MNKTGEVRKKEDKDFRTDEEIMKQAAASIGDLEEPKKKELKQDEQPK